MWHNLRSKFVKKRVEQSAKEKVNTTEMNNENEIPKNEVEEKNKFKEALKNQTYSSKEIAQKDVEILQQSEQEQVLQQPVQQMSVSKEIIIK